MTCIKTGARVLFADYDKIVSADLFQVDSVIIIRTQADALEDPRKHGWPRGQYTHTVESPPGGENQFWRDDLGVYVVPQQFVTGIPK